MLRLPVSTLPEILNNILNILSHLKKHIGNFFSRGDITYFCNGKSHKFNFVLWYVRNILTNHIVWILSTNIIIYMQDRYLQCGGKIEILHNHCNLPHTCLRSVVGKSFASQVKGPRFHSAKRCFICFITCNSQTYFSQ